MFADELEALLAEIAQSPMSGRPCPHHKHPAARRRVMRRTAYVVHCDYDSERDHIDVLAVWSTHRGRGPFD